MNFEQIEAAALPAEEEREIRAQERNKYRSLAEKLLGKNKTTEMDIAVDEAMKMNEAAEKMIAGGEAATFTEAMDKLNETEEFSLKGKETVKKEEYAQSRALMTAKKMDDGEIYKAHRIVNDERNKLGIDSDVYKLINKDVAPFAKEKIAKAIAGKNTEEMLETLRWFGGEEYVNKENFKDIPELKSPEIQNAVRDEIIHSFKFFGHNMDAFKRVTERYDRLGIISRAEMLKFPEIRQEAIEWAATSFRYNFYHPNNYLDRWQDFDKMGIISTAEIAKLPEVQTEAKKHAVFLFSHFAYDSGVFDDLRQTCVEPGILTMAEIGQFPEVRERAQDWLKTLIKHGSFDNDIEQFERACLQAGFIDKPEIDAIVKEAEKK